jgi:hypothetical protein
MKDIFLAFFLFLFFWQMISVTCRMIAMVNKVASKGIRTWQFLTLAVCLTYFVMYFVIWK